MEAADGQEELLGGSRGSLWARLVCFYATHNPAQLREHGHLQQVLDKYGDAGREKIEQLKGRLRGK